MVVVRRTVEIEIRDENRIPADRLMIGMRVRGFISSRNPDGRCVYTGVVRFIDTSSSSGHSAEIERGDRRKGGGDHEYNGVRSWVAKVRPDGFWGGNGTEGYLYASGMPKRKKPPTLADHRKNLAKLFRKYRKPHPITEEQYQSDLIKIGFSGEYFRKEQSDISELFDKCEGLQATKIRKGRMEWL